MSIRETALRSIWSFLILNAHILAKLALVMLWPLFVLKNHHDCMTYVMLE